jgi:hypothetical protein
LFKKLQHILKKIVIPKEMLEKKDKEDGEERHRERNTTKETAMPVKKKKKKKEEEEVERLRTEGRWMNVELSERDNDTEKKRKKGENQMLKVEQGVREVYRRGNSTVPGKREVQKKEK